jgi:signal transduction histidine kinase/CheY-like chemotaxis protein
MLRASLARRFIVFSSLLVLATSSSLSLFVLAHEEREHDEHIRRRGLSLARNLAHDAELGVLTRNRELLLDLARGLIGEPDVLAVTVTDAEGLLLMRQTQGTAREATEAPLVARADVETSGLGAARASITRFTRDGSTRTEAYEVGFPVFTRRGERRNEEIGLVLEDAESSEQLEVIGQARVRLSLAAMYEDLAELKWALGLLTSVVITIATVLTVALVKKMVGPLQALAEATRQIAEGRLSEVTVEASQDEIGRLARSFNQMTAELSRSRRELERYSAGLEQEVQARTRELEAAQSRLVQAEKMSAVGLLVSGVAHELNNPLAGVIGFSQLLLLSNTDEKVRRKLEMIHRDAERCKKVIQNLQTFARTHKPEKEYVGVNGIIEGTLELRSYQLRVDNIRVTTDFEPDLPKTMADYHQLQRVFLNIIINAHQAMAGQGKGGELMLRTRRRDDRILAEIEDTGPGIPPEHLGKLFDPFFTTKEVGQGTGLGLSICYGIVEEHNGRLWAENSPTRGAIFRVELPILAPEARPEGQAEGIAETPERTPPPKNILVVDDETAIVEILYHVLKSDGHRVDTAVNGEMAWRKIRKERYDLIISDLKMPGMSGQELYARVREWDLPLSRRMIFSTGDVLSSETHRFLDDSGNHYLQKPFELAAIRRAVDEAWARECR